MRPGDWPSGRRRAGPRMLLLGLSISLDELAIGFTFGLLHLPARPGHRRHRRQTLVLTQIGLRLGRAPG